MHLLNGKDFMAEYLKRLSKTCQPQAVNASPEAIGGVYVQPTNNNLLSTVRSTISGNSNRSSHENDDAHEFQQPAERQLSTSQQYTLNSFLPLEATINEIAVIDTALLTERPHRPYTIQHRLHMSTSTQ